MGTLFGLTLWAKSAAEAQAGFAAAIARAAALNKLLSDYDPNSELNAINQQPRTVPPELYRVLKFARELSEISNGAFDPTIGPLTRLWRARIPLTGQAKALVNWRDLHLESGKVWLARPGMSLDLGAIGKGFAADEMLRTFRDRGLPHALIAASGDIVCGDAPPGARGWTVAAAGRRLTLRRAAVSTSGDSAQFYVENGVRHSHILDPRRGAALTEVLEVSVVAPNGMTADALATTVRVLGPKAAGPIVRRYRAHIIGQN